MKTIKNQILIDIDNVSELKTLVAILELTTSKLNINTISEMARLENKSPNGIRNSNRYRKINIGKQVMVIKGVEDTQLPF